MPFAFFSMMKGIVREDISDYQGPVGFALVLFVFSGILIGVLIATRWIHRRSTLTIFTGAQTFRWNHLFKSGLLWLFVLAILELVSFGFSPQDYAFQFDPGPFLMVLGVALLFLPLQTTAEEVFMRGYLMQQVGLISRSPWLPILASSVIFGILHGANPEVEQYGLVKSMVLYIGMGLFFGIVTVMDDGLEMPIGMHYVNNFFAFLIVGYKGSVMEGLPSIFIKESADLTWGAVVTNLVIMLIVLMIMKKYFRWPSFNLLLKKFNSPDSSLV